MKQEINLHNKETENMEGSEAQHVRDVYDLDSDSESDSTDNPYTVDTLVNDDGSRPVRYVTHKRSVRWQLRRVFVRNSRNRLILTVFDLCLKLCICITYVVRVILDDMSEYECYGSPCYLEPDENFTGRIREDVFEPGEINWYVLLWVRRHWAIYILEVVFAFIALSKALLMVFIATKGHRREQVFTSTFLLEIICAVPMLATLAYPTLLKDIFVPVFLSCWLAKRSLEKLYNDLHLTRQRFQTISVTLLQHMMLLLIYIICLVFSNVCAIQHVQRASTDEGMHMNMFDSVYFIIVTFSTVGYGDISPDIWLSQLFMLIMICVAFATLPRHIEALMSTFKERQKEGGDYRPRPAQRNKHVIVVSSHLTQLSLMDFLKEFYAHPKLEEHTVILLSPHELDSSKMVIIKDPKWANRVIYMKGSVLKDLDLKRCYASQAEACFFLAPRPTVDKAKADRHTILRSLAVKDFAPGCKQYIQLYSAANKIHVKFAEHVVCEDEFSYALLANNCLYPGLSTLVSLLVHTSTGQWSEYMKVLSNYFGDRTIAGEPWQQVYGRHCGNEIHSIQLHKSVFFSQYDGETFTTASADAHHRFGVALLAVLDSGVNPPRLQLNPGPQYKLKAADFCFYMNISREEYTKISQEALRAAPRIQHAPEMRQVSVQTDLPSRGSSAQVNNNGQTPLYQPKYTKRNGKEDPHDSVFDSPTDTQLTDNLSKQRNLSAPLFHIKEHGSGGDDADGSVDKSIVVRSHSTKSSMSAPLLSEKSDEDEIHVTSAEDGDDKTGDEQNSVDEEKLEESPGTPGSPQSIEHVHEAGHVLQFHYDMDQDKLTIGPPPVTMYSGSRRTRCHVMIEPREFCCLEWGKHCDHCTYKNANDERWHYQLIILTAEHATSGIFNFIVPLRSSFIVVNGLSPIVLLLEEQPDPLFLETIAQFPLVYYMIGSIQNVDDLLVAGINKASHLVVVNRDSICDNEGEEILEDSQTLVAVQTIFRFFPNTYVVTQLSQTENVKLMQFSAHDAYLQQQASRLERVPER